ncbi:hypothetical protein NXW53_14470 [Bacteroides ovatus]|nr:hypothetical protein [Bacteroides ovatus]
MNIFNIHIEFDSKIFCKTVEDYIAKKQKAYVCVVDANVITIAQKDLKYREIVKGANINTCDGSSISKMVMLSMAQATLPLMVLSCLNTTSSDHTSTYW